jgi:glycerol-3-phosphate acyltransferase PlsY
MGGDFKNMYHPSRVPPTGGTEAGGGMMSLLLALLGSYVVGSFPTGFLLVKWLKRVDLRAVGSGNIGATNVGRVAGVWASILVFVIDAAKGMVAVFVIAPRVLPSPHPAAALACGLAAVVGHNFPLFLKFKGGKGVATTIGVLLSAIPLAGMVYLLVWALCLMIWRYVSVSSLAGAASIPLVQLALHRSSVEILLGFALTILIVLRHRANIERLRHGTEPRVGHRPRRP